MDDFLKKFFHYVYENKRYAKENNYCKDDNQYLQLFTSSLYLAALFSSFAALDRQRTCQLMSWLRGSRRITQFGRDSWMMMTTTRRAIRRRMMFLVILQLVLRFGCAQNWVANLYLRVICNGFVAIVKHSDIWDADMISRGIWNRFVPTVKHMKKVTEQAADAFSGLSLPRSIEDIDYKFSKLILIGIYYGINKKILDSTMVTKVCNKDAPSQDAIEGKPEEAENCFLLALKEAKEGFGERDPHVASACNNLVGLMRRCSSSF
ncbi:hypothetical protein HHK36_024471 [Tetracentron sinense]|uniref:Uncharacterized protein n=1 Tax=Tetracentron sinense TaxID=13715 RepID=A0A834YN20_TETSI|nr:hypothetical protein HHK36_024471 [Tetracentron sinense]